MCKFDSFSIGKVYAVVGSLNNLAALTSIFFFNWFLWPLALSPAVVLLVMPLSMLLYEFVIDPRLCRKRAPRYLSQFNSQIRKIVIQEVFTKLWRLKQFPLINYNNCLKIITCLNFKF